MTQNDGDTVDFGAQPADVAEAGSEGHARHAPGYVEAPAQVADAKEVEGAARPAIPGVSKG